VILKNIHIGMKLEGLYRVDVPEISEAAMREAIINTFCHRNYHDPDYVQIAIFKNRVEIRNPGTLYGGLTIDKIRKGNVSQRRNPLIAELLRRIQMVETWGRGMRLILAEEPTVQFSEVAQLFITVFNRPSYSSPDKTTDKASGKAIDKTIDKTIDKDLSITEKAIIKLIATNPSITQKEMAKHLKLTEIGIRYNTGKLKSKGILQRTGGKKAGRWEIVRQSKS